MQAPSSTPPPSAPAPQPEPGLRPRPRPAAELLFLGLWCGGLGGLGAGAIDALWSWQQLAQFAPGALSRLRIVGYCASAYGLVGVLAGVAVAVALLILMRGTRLGELGRFAVDAHQARRARDPGEAVVGLSLVLVGMPALVVAGAVALRTSVPILARRHPELVAGSILGVAVAALAIAALMTFALGRQLEVPLAMLARRPSWRWLSSVWTPAAVIGALAAAAGLAILVKTWETARMLPLRQGAAALGIAALAAVVAARRGGEPVAARLRTWSLWRRALAIGGALLVLVAGTLGFGDSPTVIKAATAYSGLGGSLARALRARLDRDGDGASWALGGGDCDDGDARIHPGAPEVPDDGIDQNCLAGDAKAATATARDLAFASLPPSVPADSNVLLVTIDTLRADHLGAYGYPRDTSPHLDRLARDGALFVHGWAHAPSTRYSMPAILTGRLPLDVFYDYSVQGWPGLAPEATTIAEVLKPLGFATGAITNYWYFDRSRRMDQGFDEYDNENARLHASVPGEGPAQTQGSSAKEQTDKALAFVERHAGGRWFLWVHYYDPHYAYEAHPSSPSFGGGRVDLYDGEIRFTDEQIGRLLDGLRARGLYDRTIVAVTGDHGEGFGEHGIDLHGYHLYAAQTKVPMIVRAPGLAGRRSETPAGHIDLLPTLANLAGARAEDASLNDVMGRSLVDKMAGGADQDRQIWQQLSYENNNEMRGAASQRCHVIYNVSPSSSWEVYRIDRDPLEAQDVSTTDECEDRRREMERWYDSSQIPRGAGEALLSVRPEVTAPLDATFGEAVRLIEVSLPAQVRRGETVEVRWTFEALDTPAAGWKVFAHVEGPTRFTGDHAPVRPFEWWKRGQFIRYTTKLSIPTSAPDGQYVVWAGLWKGTRRMPAKSASSPVTEARVPVAKLEVVP